MFEYRCYFHPDMGYCAQLYVPEGRFWRQVSHWYTSLGRLNRFFSRKHCFNFETVTSHVFI